MINVLARGERRLEKYKDYWLTGNFTDCRHRTGRKAIVFAVMVLDNQENIRVFHKKTGDSFFLTQQ